MGVTTCQGRLEASRNEWYQLCESFNFVLFFKDYLAVLSALHLPVNLRFGVHLFILKIIYSTHKKINNFLRYRQQFLHHLWKIKKVLMLEH